MRRRFVLAPALVAGTLAACSGIVGFEELRFVEDRAPETGAGTDAAADADAEADASPPPTCRERLPVETDAGAVVFCDDFEREGGDASTGWSHDSLLLEGGELVLTTERAVSGKTSIRATLPPGPSAQNKRAMLRHQFDPAVALRATIELELFVEQAPDPAGDAFQGFVPIRFFTSDVERLVLAGVPDAGAFNPFLTYGETVVRFPADRWYHVTLRTETKRTVIDVVSHDGKFGITRVLDVADGGTDLTAMWMGAETGTGGGPLRMFLDDVVVRH